MQVRDIMTTNVLCASASDSLLDVARMMRDADVGLIPVCTDGRVVGVITDRDISVRCVAEGHTPGECQVADHMSREVVTADPRMDIEEALELMGNRQVRRLPVVDDDLLMGIVSLGDLAVETKGKKPRVAQSLEEISQPIHQTEGGQPKTKAA